MSVLEIRQELHKVIDAIDNTELLQAMLTILAQGSVSVLPKEYQLTGEQLFILQEREEKYLKGESKTLSLDEFRMKMNKKYGL